MPTTENGSKSLSASKSNANYGSLSGLLQRRRNAIARIVRLKLLGHLPTIAVLSWLEMFDEQLRCGRFSNDLNLSAEQIEEAKRDFQG